MNFLQLLTKTDRTFARLRARKKRVRKKLIAIERKIAPLEVQKTVLEEEYHAIADEITEYFKRAWKKVP